MMARLAFLGTPEFAVPALERLAAAPHILVGVYTQPDRPAGRGRRLVETPVKRWASARGLPVHTPLTFKKPEAVEQLRALRPDVLVVAAYGRLLPPAVLAVPPKGALNIHPSLLPKYRGPSPVAAALLAGDSVTGVTIILLDEGMDSGPVLARREAAVAADDTTGTLTRRLATLGAELLVETLPRWLNGELQPAPQDESRATYCRLIEKKDGETDWAMSAGDIARRIRAFQPWPGSFTTWRGMTLKLLQAEAADGGGAAPGTVVPADLPGGNDLRLGRGVGIVTGRGVLVLRRLQLEGKRPMTTSEFLPGHPDFLGSRLPS